MQKNNTLIFVGALIILLAGAGVFLWEKKDVPLEKSPSSVVEEAEDIKDILTEGGIKIASAITDTSVPAPKIPHALVFPKYMTEDVRRIIEGQIRALSADIQEDPFAVDAWLDLAIKYKAIDDVLGAEEVWKYLTKAAPRSAVGFYNLGYLYHISLKDYPKSEQYFREALVVDPNQDIYYTGLHELYRYSYKQDTDAAEAILKEGLARLPASINLIIALAAYYRDVAKDLPKARAIVEKGLTINPSSPDLQSLLSSLQ